MTEMSEYYRCFIAVVPDVSLIDECIRLRDRLERKIPVSSIRWCSREQLHLTLKFFGNVEVDRIDELKSKFTTICKQFTRFHLSLENLGAFPDISFPRVIWLGVRGDLDSLMKLQTNIERELYEFGDNREEREFKPHMTLARIKNASPREQKKIGEVLKEFASKVGSLGSWRVESVILIRSILDPGGAIYQPLEKAYLK